MTRRLRIVITGAAAVLLVIATVLGLYTLSNSRTYQLFGDLVRDPPQLVTVVSVAPEREREDRHVVYRFRFTRGSDTP